ncbi:hypothetical protein Csa_014749 [Cucumis sativus]|nr:hypothetical protein Csa_014749 [Cucumis sativus]
MEKKHVRRNARVPLKSSRTLEKSIHGEKQQQILSPKPRWNRYLSSLEERMKAKKYAVGTKQAERG